MLRLAASLDQVSPHVLAGAIVRAARDRGLRAGAARATPRRVPGQGIRGMVDGRRVAVGKAAWCGIAAAPPRWARPPGAAPLDGALTVFVAVDGELAGALIARRPDPPRRRPHPPRAAPRRASRASSW